MTRTTSRTLCAVVGILAMAGMATAQGNGTLVGYVTDPDTLALPGVSVTAESPVMMGTRTALTDSQGYFRLINLPPGNYTISAELGGFSPVRRPDVYMRAGATYRVDIPMTLGTLEEEITVTAETPMLDVNSPGQVFNIEGEFHRSVPVQSRANWSDFLELTPGVNARPFDDGSGRMVYFGHATEHFHHVVQIEGQSAGGYRDAQLTYIQMDSDMLEDIEVRSGGVEASSPMGTGLVMNIVTKSGGNELHGALGYQYQPFDFNGDNSEAGETPTTQQISQVNASLGGPIVKDKVWFFVSGRYAKNEASLSREQAELTRLQQFQPGFEPFNNIFEGIFPYAKLTAQLGDKHTFSAYYQKDTADLSSNREYHTFNQELRTSGGALYGVKLNSLLSNNASSELLVSYNNKTSVFQSFDTWLGFGMTGTPQMDIHEECIVSGGRCRGTGLILQDGAGDGGTVSTGPGHVFLIRADLTYFKEGWGGSHEFKTGIFAAPSLHRETLTNYINDGFYREYRRLVDPNNAGSGTIPYRQRVAVPNALQTNDMSDSDIGFYVQDTWKPGSRLTIKAGVRVDFVTRHDNIFDFDKMKDTAIGPRLGFTYALTEDASTILRGSVGRVHEQVNGRDYASSQSAGSQVEITDYYDNDGDCTTNSGLRDPCLETTFVSRARDAALAEAAWDTDIEQPYVNEAILGLRRQFAGGFAIDAAFIFRENKNRYGQLEVNGVWPSGPNQPFGGYGLLDPDEGTMVRQTNNTWNSLVYRAIEVTATKRMSDNWQAMLGLNRQWHKLGGTWNATDRASFTQPDAFANNRCMHPPRGNRDDHNSYSLGSTHTYCPTWRPYSIRGGFTYRGPWGLLATASYTMQAGPYSGPIFYQLDEADPVFGPSTVTSSTGNTESNPMAGTVRFRFATRGEGQESLPAIKNLSIRVGKVFSLGGDRELELAANFFNVANFADSHQYTYNGANAEWNPSYLVPRSRQSARAIQLRGVLRF